MQFAFSQIDPNTPGLRRAALLLRLSRRENTWASYDGKLARFIDFCEVVVPNSGLPPLCPCPALPATIALYLGYLSEEDKVHHSSLQPYLSAINSFHQDMGFDRPAIGHLVSAIRHGFGEFEGEMDPDRTKREPIPAAVIDKILELGCSSYNPNIIRMAACIVTNFCFFLRGDTGVRAIRLQLHVDAAGIHIRQDRDFIW